MDLGIKGRCVIVCASRRGLGKGCLWTVDGITAHFNIDNGKAAGIAP